MDYVSKNDILIDFYKLIKEKRKNEYTGKLRFGVDLGTANIVIAAVDELGNPVAGDMKSASVVKDGLVVDYINAIKIVKELKCNVEDILGIEIEKAAAAVPPGTVGGNMKVISHILEEADIEVTNIVDEPTAAASMLGIKDGAVVDVGGGTTGISVMEDEKPIYVYDEPTGGTHMTLTIAGNYKISFDEAENIKKDPKEERIIFSLVRPVIEKMASIVDKHLKICSAEKIYLVGGACDFSQAYEVFEKITGVKTIKPTYPLLVTPLGIALCSEE